MKVDYAIGSQFGTWGRDIMALSQGVDENAPTANWDDRVFFLRFLKDPTRTVSPTSPRGSGATWARQPGPIRRRNDRQQIIA
jgi:hypothetical protein